MQRRVLIVLALLFAFHLGIVAGAIAARTFAPDPLRACLRLLEKDLSIPRLEWQQ